MTTEVPCPSWSWRTGHRSTKATGRERCRRLADRDALGTERRLDSRHEILILAHGLFNGLCFRRSRATGLLASSSDIRVRGHRTTTEHPPVTPVTRISDRTVAPLSAGT
jgi:hypothetical protein